MKFERRSNTLLAITKSKAKMYEFSLPEDEHIELKQPPSDLLRMTIGMLGDLSRLELQRDTSEEALKLLDTARSELRSAARYFDALNEAHQADGYAYYLNLLGASAYYLADMPGSSLILINKAQDEKTLLTDTGLEQFLDWVLIGNYSEPFKAQQECLLEADLHELGILITNFFSLIDGSEEQISEKSGELRERVYAQWSDRELLLVDLVCSVILKRIANSSIKRLPSATQLDLSHWKEALAKDSFIKEFWPAQRLLAENNVFGGASSVIQLPTSAGKTKSSELIIRSAFLSGRADLAVLVAPFRSLCREITDAYSAAFRDENISVNQLNDVPQIDEWDADILEAIFNDEILPDIELPKSVLVSTPEKLVYLLRQMPELKDEIGLVIFDEGHQFDTGARGVTYELLLANLKRGLSPGTQVVLISAVISNATTIGEWLYGEDGTVVDGAQCLSSERSIAFCSWKGNKGQLHYVDPNKPDREEYFVPRVLEQIEIPLRGRERKQKYFPDSKDKLSIATYLAFKLPQQGPVAIFCGTKITVSGICDRVLSALDRLPDLVGPIDHSNREEIAKLHYLAKLHFGENHNLTRAIQVGFLPHSSAVPNGIRVSVEYAMENSLTNCVICTSTLAQGVNLPIKYLVVSGVNQGKQRISTRDFHNLIGRAGRSGKHTEGSIIFSDSELYDNRRGRKRYDWRLVKQLIDPSKSEHCVSSLKNLIDPFSEDLFNLDAVEFAKNPDAIKEQFLEWAKENNAPKVEVDSVVSQMNTRLGHIHSIESYLLAQPEVSNEQASEEDILVILQETLAFHMASDIEKEKLIEVFNHVYSNVSAIPIEKRSAYGRALLGVDNLEKLEEWISENYDGIVQSETIEQLIELLWPILIEIVESPLISKISPDGSCLSLATLWVNGDSYHHIKSYADNNGIEYKTAKRSAALKIDQVIELCDSTLGYQTMLAAGAVADLVENNNENPEVAERLRQLQISLKLGLSSPLEHWLYSRGLIDRELCKQLKNELTIAGINDTSIPSNLMREHEGLINKVLESYPSYFTNQFGLN